MCIGKQTFDRFHPLHAFHRSEKICLTEVLYAMVLVHVVPLPTELLLRNPPNFVISQEFATVSK